MDLDKNQIKAVTHSGTPLLVTAGPGSGKTRVITERIKFLIKDEGMDPSEILCLTFSENAATELKDKLEKDDYYIQKKIDLSEMQVSTYHAFCRKLLLENTSYTGIGMRGGILDRSLFLVWGVQNIDNFDFDEHVVIGNNAYDIIEKMVDGISVFAQELVSPEELEAYVSKKLEKPESITDIDELDYLHQLNNMVKIYKKYSEFKKSIDVMDYNDLIVESNKLLEDKKFPRILQSTQKKYKHILIDEFQDNNFAQFSLIKKISKDGNVTAVGDADQNIYRFQGAYTQIFEDFKKTFPNHTQILLSNNYRNPENVIKLSAQVLSQDIYREKKKIVSTKDDTVKVNVTECVTQFSQVEFVKNKISELMAKNPSYSFGDFAILSKRQKDGLQIAQMLVAGGVPVKYIGKSKVTASPNAQMVFAFLRIISDPMNSMLSIIRILQEYGITEQNISKINREANVRSMDRTDGDYVFDVISDLNVNHLTQKKEIRDIFLMMRDFIEMAKDSLPSQTLYQIIRNKTDLYKKISNDATIESFVERSILTDLINKAYDFEKITPDATIKQFLEFSSLLDTFDVETQRDESDANAVQVSTIHKSKGLEFKVVFVIHLTSRNMPGTYTKTEFYVPQDLAKGVTPSAEPKEEFVREVRRLLYVAMTRTINHLYITYPTHHGERSGRANKASKFITALAPAKNECVNFEVYDSGGGASKTENIDAIDGIKNEYIQKALQLIRSDQFPSAVQKIVEIAKISHYKKNKTTDGFDSADFLKYEADDAVDKKLSGIVPEVLGFKKENMSYTKFSDYGNCPKMFWYKYVLNALPATQQSPSSYKGNFFHKILQRSTERQIDKKEDTLELLVKDLNDNWDSKKYIGRPSQKESQDKSSLNPALESYHKWSLQNKNTVVAAELKFDMHIGGFLVKGSIDRVEKTPDGEYTIIDYKTGGQKKKIEDVHKSLQLNMYCMGLQEKAKYGKPPIRATYFYVEKPEGEQLFDYDVDPANIKEAKEKLEGYAKSIIDKNFEATPNMKMCGWCEFSDICSDSAK